MLLMTIRVIVHVFKGKMTLLRGIKVLLKKHKKLTATRNTATRAKNDSRSDGTTNSHSFGKNEVSHSESRVSMIFATFLFFLINRVMKDC